MLKKLILFFCFLFLFVALFAQNQSEKPPLQSILLKIEKEHNVKFSYNSNLIKGTTCIPFKNEKTLKEKLANLSKQTYLNFNKIDARYIVIAEKEITKNNIICGVLTNKL